MKVIKKVFELGGVEYTLETGRVARQAHSVWVSAGETVVLATAVVAKQAKSGIDFLPLSVHYQERMYAAGRIPGGFFKREGRPTAGETLTSRLIDRPIRPLFPKGYHNEIQVVLQVLSLDPNVAPDMPALIGASAALCLSGAPFGGPIGGVRVGYIDNQFVLNPSYQQLEESQLDLVVAGTQEGVLMVESEAKILSEKTMLDAVMFGHEAYQIVIAAITQLRDACGGEGGSTWQAPEADAKLQKTVQDLVEADITKAYLQADKMKRNEALSDIRAKVVAELFDAEKEDNPWSEAEILKQVGSLEKTLVRNNILAGQPRIDGRDTRTVRPILIETSVLPRTHGSALFTRGETQALVTTTLGTGKKDAQIHDTIHGEHKDSFMLHYNFPPYSVGETGMMSGPKRREIGHGNLARMALKAVLPSNDEFPYVMRVVSDITESNGSSSMATVCGGSLSLMDAGAPLKAPVAGIAMGLIKEGGKFAVLTDILGDEDHLGDMDFKVAGTEDGITALQMDIKITSITKSIMESALDQAKEGRTHILSLMNDVIEQGRGDLSKYAPRMHQIKVPVDKIRDVIGKGGATIKSITEDTGAVIEIDDDGTVNIFSADENSASMALKRVEDVTADAKVGTVYDGVVVRIVDFGAFVSILSGGKEGLVHVSQIAEERVEKVTDYLSEGQAIRVKVTEIDRQGRIRMSMRNLDGEVKKATKAQNPEKSETTNEVKD